MLGRTHLNDETKTHEDDEDPGVVPIIEPLRVVLEAINQATFARFCLVLPFRSRVAIFVLQGVQDISYPGIIAVGSKSIVSGMAGSVKTILLFGATTIWCGIVVILYATGKHEGADDGLETGFSVVFFRTGDGDFHCIRDSLEY